MTMAKSRTSECLAKVIPLVTPLTVHGSPHPDVANCSRCTHNRHHCPVCGDWLYHGVEMCLRCERIISRQGKRRCSTR